MAEASHSHAHSHSHSHGGDERANYYLDQLFMIGICAAVGAVTVVLWRSATLIDLLHEKFNLFVGAGGITLLAIVIFRAAVVWLKVDEHVAAEQKPSDCGHTHSAGESCGHSHGNEAQKSEPLPVGASADAMSRSLAPTAPAHSHSHAAHSHAGHGHDHDHSHGGQPWRYIVLLLPVVLYFLVLANPKFKFGLSEDMTGPLDYIRTFITIFASILWEALPFIILGSLLAGILDEFLPQAVVAAIVPRNPVLAVCLGGLLGLVFPMCECGIIPIMRRLLKKGLPLSCCVAYLLAGPIVNVVVLASTIAAFSGMENAYVAGVPSYQMNSFWMTLFRGGLGYLVAVVTGFVVHLQFQKYGDSLLTPETRPAAQPALSNANGPRRSMFERLGHASEKALDDFVDITVFLILGALLSASVRMFLKPDQIAELGSGHPMLAIGVMMAFAVVLCLCSEADAFVAASFVALRPSAKLAFLVLGPMLDFKLYAMYTRIFRPRLILTIYVCVVAQVFAYSVATHYFWEANKERLVTPKPPEPIPPTEEELNNQSASVGMMMMVWGRPMPEIWQANLIEVVTASRGLSLQEKPREVSFLQLESMLTNPQLRTYFNGKLVKMDGEFAGNEKQFTLLRYKRNCCAADATPLKAYFTVKASTFNASPYARQWVQAIGRLRFAESQVFIDIQPNERESIYDLIKIIPKPTNPYLD